MKILLSTLAACTLGASTDAHATPIIELPSGTDATPTSPAPQDRSAEFKTKFRQALEINAKDEIAKLVRAYTDEATNHVIELCGTLANGTTEQIEKEMGALRDAWKTAFKSSFVEKMYNYFSLIDPRTAKELPKLNREYDAAYKKFVENQTKKDHGVSILLAETFEGIGKAYSEVGYHLFAARAHNLAGVCLDTATLGSQADLDRAADNFGASVRSAEAFDLNDAWSMSVKARFEALTREGKGAAAANVPGAAPKVTTEPVKAAEPVVSPMHFELVPSIEAVVRPSYSLDEIHVLWPIVYMREKGTSGNFQSLKKIKVLRTGAASLMLDLDGDDKGDQQMPSSGNKSVVKFPIGEGGEKRDWAVLTEVGTDKENYQGLQVNVSPTDKIFVMYVLPAASVVGTLNGVPVRVFDDNMDGVYGSPPSTWQYVGVSEGKSQPDMDAIQVGAEKKARPWSEYSEIGGAWFQLQPAKNGMELSATPTTLEAGKLKLQYKGEMPEYVVLQGDGKLANTWIDLLQNGGAEVNAPAGKYKLYMGIVRKGKKMQLMKALMIPGPRTPAWDVEPGKTTTVQLGAPFGFDFSTEVKGESLVVKGKSVVVIGSKDERYERLWNCAPRPELVWRKAGTKRGSKPERFSMVENLNEVDDQGRAKYEYADTFYPLDLSVEVKLKEGETAEVQLVEKKNKLFGVIESDWR